MRVFLRAGFEQVGQRGSHVRLRRVRNGVAKTVVVVHPRKETPRGAFDAYLDQAGMTHGEFDALL
jgi:predicted RNA binding protein YcfA (HicA-like mRNA interferase family)